MIIIFGYPQASSKVLLSTYTQRISSIKKRRRGKRCFEKGTFGLPEARK
jgi:hypothetical protein